MEAGVLDMERTYEFVASKEDDAGSWKQLGQSLFGDKSDEFAGSVP